MLSKKHGPEARVTKMPPVHPQHPRTIFLNAVAFGIVAPLLYFMIALPAVKWIALLLVVDSLGRVCGGPVTKALIAKLGAAAVASLEAINAFSYLLLAIVGFLRPAQTPAFAIIYASRFLGAFASANFPAVRLINSDKHGISIAQIGFAIGCAITAAIGNHHFLPDSILVTGGLLVPGLLAAGVSVISATLALRSGRPEGALYETAKAEECPVGATATPWIIANAGWILLACEAAYGMLFCVLPLTTREICAFSPLTTAVYFAIFALLSVAVTQPARSLRRSTTVLIAGIILSSIGFAGISVALGLSWHYDDPNRQLKGTIAAWIAGTIGGIGHGLLRAALPAVQDKISLKLTRMFPAVAAIGALVIARLWAEHERSAFAIPAAIMLMAAPCALVMMLDPRKKTVAVSADVPSQI